MDLSVGLVLNKKVGDYVEAGEPLALIHANREERAAEAERRFLAAVAIGGTAPEKRSLIKTVM